MKLKYQMRGLGIGMIVTALLMGVAVERGIPLSDAEIKAKALALGMVESDSLRLTDISNNSPIPLETLPPIQDAASVSEPNDEIPIQQESEEIEDKSENSTEKSGEGPEAEGQPESSAERLEEDLVQGSEQTPESGD